MKVILQCCPYAQEYHRERVNPVGRVWVRLEGCLQLAMEAFDETVGYGMVGCCANPLGTKEVHELIPEGGLKLAASIG